MFARNLANRLHGFSLDLLHRHAGEALPHAGYRLASQLDTGGAFEQLAVAPPGTALALSIEQIGVDLDAGG